VLVGEGWVVDDAVGSAVCVTVAGTGVGGTGLAVRVAVGGRDAVGIGVDVGMCVFVADGTGVNEGVGRGVRVGRGSGLAVAVGVIVRVLVIVLDGVAEAVALGRGLEVAVGGSPSRTNRPDVCQSVPTKICTSYTPGSHSGAGRSQLATATPGGKSFHEVVSTYLSAPLWYHSAVHSTFTPTGW